MKFADRTHVGVPCCWRLASIADLQLVAGAVWRGSHEHGYRVSVLTRWPALSPSQRVRSSCQYYLLRFLLILETIMVRH